VNKSPRELIMNKRVLDWVKKNIGRRFESPEGEFFGKY
jgi:hypothetical protein